MIAVNHFPPRYTAGSENQAFRIASNLRDRGYRVQVVCVEHLDRGPADGRVEGVLDQYEGLDVYRMNLKTEFPRFPAREEFDNRAIGEYIGELIDRQKPDVFHQIGGYLLTGRPLLVAKGSGIPTILMLMDYWFLCPRIQMLRSNGDLSSVPIDPVTCLRCLKEERRRFRVVGQMFPALARAWWSRQSSELGILDARMSFCRSVLEQADLLISNSKFLRKMYVDAGIRGERIVTLRQGVDQVRPSPTTRSDVTRPVVRVGYVGQISQHKGVHLLVRAIKLLPGLPIGLHVYGDYSQNPAYVKRLHRLKGEDDRIFFEAPFQGGKELTRVLNGLDVLVVPSTWYENSPNVILEAFSHKIPVVASNLGGMSELVKHDTNGLLFELDNPEDLAKQLQRLVREPGLLGRLKEGIRPVSTVDQEMDELVQLYLQVTAHGVEQAPSLR